MEIKEKTEQYKIPKNEFKITQEQWDEFQDEFQKDKEKIEIQLQEINDILESGLTTKNIVSFRNTYVITIQDSLDSSYPMLVPFDILSEMIKIIKIEVSFRILPYRAYCDNAGDSSHGIYEETNSTSISFSISEDGGITYGDIVGTYTEDKLNIDISSLIGTIGVKILKFESTALVRLSVQVTIKIDVKAR